MSGSIDVLRMTEAKIAFGDRTSADFKRVAEAAPFTLRSLGLGSGIATLCARKGPHGTVIAAMIARWLLERCPHPHYRTESAPSGDDDKWAKTLLERLAKGSRAEYRAAQAEALAYATWIKRLAQAFCDDGTTP